MAGRCAAVPAIVVVLGGCATSQPAQLPADCLAEPAAIARALERVPAHVTLAGGTRLSACVRLAAARDADLQALAPKLTQVADDLRDRAAREPEVALRLGYLTGAVRRGAAQTPGVAAQLARRVEQVAALQIDAAAARRELARGIRLGEAGG